MSESKNTSTVEREELKKVLGRKDLMSIGVGQIIGAGIFSLTGVAIGLTGRSTNLAFMVAAILTIMQNLPTMLVGGTVRMKGGTYTQAAFLMGKKYAGFYMVLYIISNISIAMYAISFAQYVGSVIPALSGAITAIAVIVLTTFYILNIFGIEGAAFVQNLLVVLLAAAMGLFIAFGVVDIQPGYFQQPGWITGGLSGFLTASAMVKFATGGAQVVVNYGAEAKNPTKDIPFVIVFATLGVAAVYAFVSTIAAGVLPVEVVANQPLTWVAQEIMPPALFYFFIIAGAGFALTTTLNATLGWVTKPLLQATYDGWFPAKLGYVHPKYKTPVVWLSIMYGVAMLTIFTGWDIGAIASFSQVISSVNLLIMSYSVVNMPKVIPEIWEKSSMHSSNAKLWAFAILGMAASLFQTVVLGMNLTQGQVIGNVVIVIVGIIYANVMAPKVDIEISYSAD